MQSKRLACDWHQRLDRGRDKEGFYLLGEVFRF